jgi:hypothetical protein
MFSCRCQRRTVERRFLLKKKFYVGKCVESRRQVADTYSICTDPDTAFAEQKGNLDSDYEKLCPLFLYFSKISKALKYVVTIVFF